MKRFAISDIHGCLKTFKALLKQISFSKSDELYLLGDYIDRGPDSKGVIDYIWQLQSKGFQVHCLKGNHEQMMLDSFSNLKSQRNWLMHGGWTTIESFKVQNLHEISRKYIHWLKELAHFKEIKGYILVHAGLNMDFKNPLEDQVSMLWIRNWYQNINKDWLRNRVIVHGHTPVPQAVIENSLKNLATTPAIDIDGGCVFVDDKYQKLCAFDLDDQKLYFQKRREKRPMR